MKALLALLKSLGIDVEIKTSVPLTKRKQQEFSLAAGLWKDYQLNGSALRKRAWQRNYKDKNR